MQGGSRQDIAAMASTVYFIAAGFAASDERRIKDKHDARPENSRHGDYQASRFGRWQNNADPQFIRASWAASALR